MTPKRQFLYKLAIQIEYAERAVRVRAEDTEASAFAQALQSLNESLSRFPEDHLFFRQWSEREWRPVALSDGPASETTPRHSMSPAMGTQAAIQAQQ